MRELQGAGQGNDQGDVISAQAALALNRRIFLGSLVGQRRLDNGTSGNATGHGGVVVNVELEEMEHGVRDEVDGAIDVLLDTKVDL